MRRAVQDVAQILARARARPGSPERQKIGDLPEALLRAVDSEADAYAVQAALHDLLQQRVPELGTIVGTKIGCTTAVMQEYLEMPHPCAGGIWSSTVAVGDGTFGGLWRPGVECEIAARLAHDIVPRRDGAAHTRETVSPSVGSVMAAIEVVDDRYEAFERRVPPPMVWVADDFFGAGCCLAEGGVGRADWEALDLAAVEGVMEINGEPVGRGAGRDIISGHPHEALAWLANKRAQLRPPPCEGSGDGPLVAAGELVLLGSVVQTKWVQKGDVVTVRFPGSGLGSATARFA